MHWVPQSDMCSMPTDPKLVRETTPPPGDPETTRLKLSFLGFQKHPEPPFAQFYRWFVLHSIHKRNFKQGAFKDSIPLVYFGDNAWKIEKILSKICSSTCISDSERATLCTFLDEYHQLLKSRDGVASTDAINVAAWAGVKRMFDMDDPTHIAGKSWFNVESKQQDWNHEPALEKQYQTAASAVNTALRERESLEGMTPQKSKKRVVSGSAAWSTSPTKKNKFESIVREINPEGMCII
ncbi:hypothetical protein NHQ30_004569 [Ciborinia camelliae]|nr:hypothetical protein NHQ30_004569 [Ciborinia camelliae]